jgi:uncharacterized membrane protein YfcA
VVIGSSTRTTNGPCPDGHTACYNEIVRRRAGVALYVLALIGVVVGVDVAVLRYQFLPRLVINIAIVVVFAVFYTRFLRRP